MIFFDAVSLRFGTESLFDDFSFHVKRGEKATLLGPSGIGKTSLLKLIPAFLRPDTGAIRIAGKQISPATIQSIRRLIAYVPQNFNGRGRVEDRILQPFSFRVNREIAPQRSEIKRLLDSLHLDENILNKDLSDISGGQKQRIALLIALLLKRPILILDEATSALDNKTKRAIIRLLMAMKDVTILAASHDREWAKNSNRLIRIKK